MHHGNNLASNKIRIILKLELFLIMILTTKDKEFLTIFQYSREIDVGEREKRETVRQKDIECHRQTKTGREW